MPGGELASVEVRPRDVLGEVLTASKATERGQNPGFKDIATVVEGAKDDQPLTIRVDTTAWPHEAGVEPQRFFTELADRHIHTEITITEQVA